jgi:hypothetical protein
LAIFEVDFGGKNLTWAIWGLKIEKKRPRDKFGGHRLEVWA